MIRNQNGTWMDPRFIGRMALNLQQFAEGESGEAGASGDEAPGSEGTNDEGADGTDGAGQDSDKEALNAEIARLKAEMAKQKAAMDKAAKEAGEARKALKAKMTAEEIAAKEKEEADEKAAQELDELRKEVAKGKTVKSVMGKLGTDEEVSGKLADYLYGANDIENALLEIQKAWMAREKALRLEFGRVPPPGAGGNGENSAEQAAIQRATQLGKDRSAAIETAKKAMEAYIR